MDPMDSRSDLDKANMKGYTALHNAIKQNDVPLLNYLLKQKDVDLNSQNTDGETALMLSIVYEREYSTIMQLIKAGCDVNIASSVGETPLLKAIYLENLDIAHELIKQGADIEASSNDGDTLLFHAIEKNHLEICCMLLYYGANVNITNKIGQTPLTYAMQYYSYCKVLVSLLLPYYDNINYTDVDNYSPLHLAMELDSDLAFELLELGADVNGITNAGYCALEITLTLQDDGAKLFKKIWSKLDYQILLDIRVPLLYTYINQQWQFTSSEWVECLYLILECPIAFDLLQHYICYNQACNAIGIFSVLIDTLNKRKVEFNHRMNIISIFLTLGVHITLADLTSAMNTFGFKEEFEMLVYATGNFSEICPTMPSFTFTYNDLLLLFILGMEDFNIDSLREIMINESRMMEITENSTFNESLAFFSLSHARKKKLMKYYSNSTKYRFLADKINLIPEFPSLLELSRNQAHKFIRQKYEIKKPYHFQDAIKNLCLPQFIKDVIRFKKPIYEL